MKAKAVCLNAMTLSMMIEALINEGPISVKGLHEQTGLGMQALGRYMRALKKRNLVRIGDWGVDGRGAFSIQMWSWGGGRDARRKQTPRREINARYQARRRELARLHAMAGRL